MILSSVSKWVDTFSVFLESELCPKHDYPIILGNYTDFSMKFIFYNTEQLTRKSNIDNIINIAKHVNCMKVWDYSKINIELWTKHNITAIYVPPVSTESFLSKLRKYREAGQLYDIGFSGGHSPRRNHIIKCLRDRGYKINYIYDIFGEDRDKELAKCKILLNIHAYDDYKIFENARCEPWLAIKVPVISENSLDNDRRCINVNYDDMVNCVVKLLKIL